MTRKKNIELWNHLLKELNDFEIQAGWFENSRYKNDTPIAGIAAVQNYGATITQSVTEKQRKFLHLIGIHLKKTTDSLNIIIPARPFMDNAKARIIGQEGKEYFLMLFIRVFSGKLTTKQAALQFGKWMQLVIQEEIKKIDSPPLSPLTIKSRSKSYTSKAKKENQQTSEKPLNRTGIMWDTVQNKVELK